ncbi:antibiotic biosynthesis monooxygenase [Sphingobium sp. Sx8-8]|uniref:putative quinol monooxygenase n=1 Tax=Sphingobium sp. Sx8-8 TaxID=2933617 RepID=UPI001F59DC10|nr:antibiotic biosynthesis monooxygenase [Sphingobium sp. Sx8-8]
MDAAAPDTTLEASTPADTSRAGVVKALFVRLSAKEGKGDEVEAFLRDALQAVRGEHDTTTWYALRLGQHDFAIFDTFPGNEGRLTHLAGKVGRTLVARTPELFDGMPKIEHARVLAYKLPGDSGQVRL